MKRSSLINLLSAVLAAAVLMAAPAATRPITATAPATATATATTTATTATTTTVAAGALLDASALNKQTTMAAIAASDADFDPTTFGPCGIAPTPPTTTLQLDPAASGCRGGGCSLGVTVTARPVALPNPPLPLPARCTVPPAVVLVIPGFSARAFMYAPYARLLASWGYAAVQYEPSLLSSFPPLNDAYEGSPAFVAALLASATTAAATTGLTLNATPAPMAIGHSRGGKIAALMLASKAVSTAALLDPVDGGLRGFFPPNPSAVELLRANPPAAGALVVQAGVQGFCNGAIVGGDSLFWNALVDGSPGNPGPSWRTILPKAGHASLALLGPLQPIAGLICGGKVKNGGLPEAKAIEIAKTAALEWIERYWVEQQQSVPAEPEFCGFVAAQSAYMTPVEREDGSLVCAA